jgi:hypothetical protein
MTCLLVIALLAACGPRKPPGAEAPATDDAGAAALSIEDAAALAAGFRDVLVAMAEVVKARGGAACGLDAGVPDGGRCADCAAMATDLGGVFDRAEPLFARAREVQGNPDDARVLTDAMRAEESGVARLVDEITIGLTACAGNADLQRVIERMPTL